MTSTTGSPTPTGPLGDRRLHRMAAHPGSGPVLNLRDHVVVCGMTNLGFRVVEQLHLSGVPCVVIDDEFDARLRRQVERWGVPFLAESTRTATGLLDAGVDRATAVIALEESDLHNLDIALLAADLVEGVRTVVRLGNARLGEQLLAALPNVQVLSLPEKAGPSFVEACVQTQVLHAFRVGGETLEVVDVSAPRAGPIREVYGDLTPVALRTRLVRHRLELCPSRDTELTEGDELTLLGRPVDFEAQGVPVRDAQVAAELVALSSGRDATALVEPRRRRAARRSPARWLREVTSVVAGEVNRPFRVALATVGGIVLFSTVLLTLAYENNSVVDPATGRPKNFDALDALYFTTTVVATVGFGDYNFSYQDSWLQAYGIFLILVGAAAVAALYALVTNVIVSRRLEQALGRRSAVTARGHVIVCGLGSIGLQVVDGLLAVGREVVVIERDENNRYVGQARARRVPIVFGDATLRATLRLANLRYASCLAAVTSSDIANVETVLTARSVHEQEATDRTDLRVVLRIFDTALADRVEKRFGIHSVRSASALASPWFVGAALGYEVISTFYAERQPFLVARMRVEPGGGLDGVTLQEMSTGTRMLAVAPARHLDADQVGRTGRSERPAGWPADHRPPRLAPGDEALLVGPYQQVIAAFRTNRPAR
jgi:Trk K+ transport system NAD-binding subunit